MAVPEYEVYIAVGFYARKPVSPYLFTRRQFCTDGTLKPISWPESWVSWSVVSALLSKWNKHLIFGSHLPLFAAATVLQQLLTDWAQSPGKWSSSLFHVSLDSLKIHTVTFYTSSGLRSMRTQYSFLPAWQTSCSEIHCEYRRLFMPNILFYSVTYFISNSSLPHAFQASIYFQYRIYNSCY